MTFPANISVGWHVYSAGAVDANNEPTVVYTPPLDETGATLKVIDVAPVRGIEPDEARIVDRLKIHAPPDTGVAARDVIDLTEGQFEVDGAPEDHTRGFHGWNPGVVIWLKRVRS